MMGSSEPTSALTCKYVVAPRRGTWRVTGDNAEEGAFAAADEAIAFACGLAREQAYSGRIGIVVVEAGVKELHCFTPDHASRPASPRLRVVAERRSA